jgi:beta-lactamase class A
MDADFLKTLARKKAVAGVLGPRVEEKLRVVESGSGFSLVYLRHGDAQGSKTTAAAHSKLLRKRGLGEAVPVESRTWVEASRESALRPVPEPSAAAAPEKASSRLEAAKPPEADKALEQSRLSALIDEHVRNLRRQGRLASDERTAWSVYDFTTGEKLVEINTDISLQAGSLIKPFVAMAYMHEVREGRLAYDKEGQRRLVRMIQHSDNSSTNWMMRKLGGPAAVQRLLQKNYGNILPGVQIVEYIPRGGRTYRNKASARDYSRFLYALWKDEIPGSVEIKRVMALPKRDRLATGVSLPDDVEVYSKTGSTSHLCGDMGVLQAKGPDGRQYAYTVIGIIEKKGPARNYLRWLRARGNVIREISGLVYQGIASIHGFASAE